MEGNMSAIDCSARLATHQLACRWPRKLLEGLLALVAIGEVVKQVLLGSVHHTDHNCNGWPNTLCFLQLLCLVMIHNGEAHYSMAL